MKAQEIKEQIKLLPSQDLIELENLIQNIRRERSEPSTSQYHYYCGPDAAVRILMDSEIKLSSPLLVNDPFEFLPQGSSENESSHWRELKRYVSNPWHFLSLSKYPDNIRMWAQYGGGHTGLMLTLDFEQQPLLKLRNEVNALIPVVYHQAERVAVFQAAGQRRLTAEHIKQLASSKGIDWAHEGESRLLLYKEHCFAGPSPENDNHFAQLRVFNGHMAAFLKLPHECIRKVTIGIESHHALVDTLLKIREAKKANWQITALRISPKRFGFDEEPIEP